uniref:chitin synthase n=1 Tax=Echeneis naucrates TaxID=173247 RepID=A0A665UUZ0_ECHNA
MCVFLYLRDTWDPFQLNPVGSEKESKRRCFRLAQYLVAVIVGLAVLTSAVIAKGSLLLLSTLSSPTSMRSPKEKQFYMLMLVLCLVFPNFLVLIKSLWRCTFKSFVQPNIKTMSFVCAIECLVSLGTSVLILVVMPQFDVLTNLFISGGVCIVSATLQIVFRLQRETWKIVFPLCSLILTVAGYCLMGLDYYVRVSSFVDRHNNNCFFYIGIGIFSSLLISLCWWENPLQATNRMQDTLSELDGFRDFVFVISSILRIIVIGAVYLIYNICIQNNIIWLDFNLQMTNDRVLLQIGLVVFFLQAFCSAACHWFGVVACKIHAVRMSFALPVCCTGPTVLLLGLVLFVTQAQKLDGVQHESITEFCESLVFLSHKNTTPVVLLEITRSICRTSLNSYYLQWPFSMLALEGVCMWSGFVTCTYYVWKIKVQRIERTSQLFVRRLYESAFIDLSLLLNTKMKVPRARNQESHDEMQSCVIYLCATIWHETYDEMLKILTSMFRLDRYRGDPKEDHKDRFDFECHIYVDDAFMTEKHTQKRLVNDYVNCLIQVVIEVYRVFTNKEPDDVSIIEAPYGGRLMIVMPEGNMLYIHFKDKNLIRNKKRWSQIMYLYYLLGWKGYIVKNPQKIPCQKNPTRASLISLDGESFLLPQYDNDNKRKFISDDNTYILALDGDTDFQPKAVILLVDRLRMYNTVGAACGRIHPTGMGPMVWYQKFEYAVGHWLQKTAEHVFGSVLCSPGCFSLFRGSALMDDNVLKRYTTTATRASEYVQYDQGEDRWLCTLLLQQGWRVEYNAASDAYTNSPQEFEEFYNQRRRWGPSTLANTLDLLHSGSETVKRNTSISRLYILYQMFTVGSSILGPASVTLMIAGAFQFIFEIAGTLSIIIASIPPVFYVIICFVTKSKTQIVIAGIMSVLYAFLMTASFFSIIGDMVIQGTFLTPTGLFLVSMTIMYLVTAILHPEEFGMIVYGLMYFICIPSGYLLLTIYSLVNMHIVSWGTRESNKGGEETKKSHNVVCDKNCRICCWDMKIQISQETERLITPQMTTQDPRQVPALPIVDREITSQSAAMLEPQAKITNTKEKAGEVTKHVTDKAKQDTKAKDNGSSRSDENAVKRSLSLSSDEDDYDHLMSGDLEELEETSVSDWVKPVKEEFLKKLTYANLKRNLQEQIRYTLRNKNQDELCDDLVLMLTDTLNAELGEVGPENVLTQSQLEELQYALAEQARCILKTSRMEKLERRVKRAIDKTLTAPQVQKLDEGEQDFWTKLIERYLKPIVDTKAHQMEVTRELKSLRNKAVFLYFIINVLWVVATFFLQAIGNDVISIKIPKYYPNGNKTGEYLKVEPLSLMFLLSFAVLLLIQFLAMLYHRVYTLIHVVSYRSTEKDYKITDEVRMLKHTHIYSHHTLRNLFSNYK